MFLTRVRSPLQTSPEPLRPPRFSISGISGTPAAGSGRIPRDDRRQATGRPDRLLAGFHQAASVLFPSNTKEYPRCAEAHLGYDVPYPNRLHTGWGLVGRRRDARLSGQSCPGAGALPGGRGHTGLTTSQNRVKRVGYGDFHDCLRLRPASAKSSSDHATHCGDRRRQRCSKSRALGLPETPAGFYRPSARTSSAATRST
jgi:hypothetical protein